MARDRVLVCGNCDGKWWRVVTLVKLPARGPHSGTQNREYLLRAGETAHRTADKRVRYECDNCGQALVDTIREADDAEARQ